MTRFVSPLARERFSEGSGFPLQPEADPCLADSRLDEVRVGRMTFPFREGSRHWIRRDSPQVQDDWRIDRFYWREVTLCFRL